MQWNLVTNSSNPADYPEPGEQVLGLWLGGFWKKIIYSPDEGWCTARDGVEQAAPTWWSRVDTAVAKQLPPQGDTDGCKRWRIHAGTAKEKCRLPDTAVSGVWRGITSGATVVFSQSERAARRRRIADYAITHDTIETAAHFNISQGMVRNACKEFGIVPRTAVKSIGCRTLDVLKHLLDGKSQTKIAEELKLSRQRVHAVAVAAKAAGITLPESSE